jgi:hypothetical protein
MPQYPGMKRRKPLIYRHNGQWTMVSASYGKDHFRCVKSRNHKALMWCAWANGLVDKPPARV